MLRLNFRSLTGDSPTVMLASCLRFCADGTLRGSDNCVVARCLEGCWQVGGRMHRELECEGPVRVRLNLGVHMRPLQLGPFANLRTSGGLLYGDGVCLDVTLPGRARAGNGSGHELTLLSDGGPRGQA
jgi:hypothetical protein